MQWLGQALTQAGFSPISMLSTHNRTKGTGINTSFATNTKLFVD
jgi:hypothetical protein